MELRTLVAVSLFYRNDRPNGFGAQIHPDIYNSLKAEADECWQGMRADFCNDDALAAYLIDQLKGLGECKRAELTSAQQMLAILNILLLTERGYLPNDEFNGVLLCYTNDNAAKEVTDALFSGDEPYS